MRSEQEIAERIYEDETVRKLAVEVALQGAYCFEVETLLQALDFKLTVNRTA